MAVQCYAEAKYGQEMSEIKVVKKIPARSHYSGWCHENHSPPTMLVENSVREGWNAVVVNTQEGIAVITKPK